MTNRRIKEYTFNNAYEKLDFYEGRCYYCGEFAGTVDHVPALDNVASNGTSYYQNKGISLVLVDCCLECNVLLGNKSLDTLEDRKQYLCKKYKLRYKKILAAPNWTDEELEEISCKLKFNILEMEKQKRKIQERIEWVSMF